MTNDPDITTEYWYPIGAHPDAGGAPWFEVDNEGLIRRFVGHPMGPSATPSFHVVDGIAFTTGADETKFCDPGVAWFSVNGSMVRRGKGHPDGPSSAVMYEQRAGTVPSRRPGRSEVRVVYDQDVLVACIEFADTSNEEYDVVECAQRLANRCVALVDGSGAGVMLADRDGALTCVASSSDEVRIVELSELEDDEGPSIDAFHTGTSVHRNTGATERSDAQWPRFTTRARKAGFASVSVLPMRLRAETIGTLSLFSLAPLSSRDQMVVQALADIATIGILQQRALSDGRNVVCQLETALGSRVVIEQAKGILAERLGVSTDVAFTLLRSHARRHNAKLRETARGVLDGTVSIETGTRDRFDVRGSA